MRIFRLILYTLTVLILLIVLATGWVVGTPSGLRAALSIADEFLPEALDLGSIEGTLIRGVILRDGAWLGESVQVEVSTLRLELDAAPLLRGDIRLAIVEADGVVVTVAGAEEATAEIDAKEPIGPFEFSMPIPLEIVDGRLTRVTIRGGAWTRDIARIELGASATDDRLDVSMLRVESDWLDLDLAGEARLAMPYPLRIAGSWRFRVSEELELAGAGSIEGDGESWQVGHHLDRPLVVDSRGVVRREGSDLSARIFNDWERIDWELPDGRMLIATAGQLTLEGWIDRFRFGADGTIGIDGLPTAQVELAGEASPERIVVLELGLVSEAGVVDASGRLDILPVLSWDMRFETSGLKPHLLGLPIEADITAAGQSDGEFRDAGPSIGVVLESLTGSYLGREARGSGSVRYTDGQFETEGLVIEVGRNRLQVDGRVGDELALALVIEAPDLVDIWPELAGSAAGRIRVTGEFSAPILDGSLQASNLVLEEYRVGSLSLSGEGGLDSFMRLSIEAGEVIVAGQTLSLLKMDLAGTPANSEITITMDAADANLRMQMAGGLEGSEWLGRLLDLELEQPSTGIWRLVRPAYIGVGLTEVDLGDTCLEGAQGEAFCIGGTWNLDEGGRFVADAERLRLPPLEQFFPPGTDIQGFASASAELAWQDGWLSGEARLDVPRGLIQTRLDEEDLAEIRMVSLAARASVEKNRLRLDIELDLGSEGRGTAWLESDDLLDDAAPVDGEINVSFTDLSLTSLLLPEVDQVRGVLEGRLKIAGTRKTPLFDGSIILSGGSLHFPAAGLYLTDIRIEARQDQVGQITYRGEARSGDGTATIRGTTRYEEERGWIGELTIGGTDFQVVKLPDMEASASPELDILIDSRQVAIKGNLLVPRADITLRELVTDAVSPSPDAVVHGEDERIAAEASAATLTIDVNVVLGEEVKLQGFGLQTELEGSLRLTGGSDSPWLGYGRLSLVGGRYKAYGQNLVVERGELLFSGPLDNPVLDIRAVRDAGEVVAGIQLTGTVRAPLSSVFSEPPLTEAEALSYLLTGRPLSGASSSDGDLLSRAALSLGLSQAGSIAAQVRQSVGLDTLAVEGGSTDGRVLAGKWLGPDLYLQYAYGIFDKIGTLLVRYKLTKRLELESRSGEYHALDIIYRVEKD